MTTTDPTGAPPARPVFKVVRKDTGEIIAPGTIITDSAGEAHTFRYATRPTIDGRSGKVVVSSAGGHEHELYAHVFGLRVDRVIPDHNDIFEHWCRFSGVTSTTGECPVCPADQVAGGGDRG